MNKDGIKYLINRAKEEGVRDVMIFRNGSLVDRYGRGKSHDRVIELLQEFFRGGYGEYRLVLVDEIFDKNLSQFNTKEREHIIYDDHITIMGQSSEPKEEKSMNIGGLEISGDNTMGMHPIMYEVMQLKVENAMLKKDAEHKTQNHAKEIEEIRNMYEEKINGLEDNKSEFKEIMGSLGSYFMANGGNTMNGVAFTESKTKNMNTEKERLIQAINTLQKLDANFITNLCKLAELAETKPFIYNQAINQLNKL